MDSEKICDTIVVLCLWAAVLLLAIGAVIAIIGIWS